MTAATAPDRAAPVLLTGAAELSAAGTAPGDLAAAVRAGRDARGPTPDLPLERAGTVAFDMRAALGPKGTRSLDRVTGLTAATAAAALASAGIDPADGPVGLVLGTAGGSVESVSSFTRATLTGRRPFDVNPALATNIVPNSPAGQTAIRLGLTGVNATVAGGRVSGLLAVQYAARLLRLHRCGPLLAGAAAELGEHRAWSDVRSRPAAERRERPIGEGAALAVLRAGPPPPGRPVLGELLATATGLVEGAAGLERLVARVLARAGVDPAAVARVAAVRCGVPAVDAAHDDALAAALGRRPTALDLAPLVGDTEGAAAALHLHALLADPDGDVRLLTVLDTAGEAGAALVRTRSPEERP